MAASQIPYLIITDRLDRLNRLERQWWPLREARKMSRMTHLTRTHYQDRSSHQSQDLKQARALHYWGRSTTF